MSAQQVDNPHDDATGEQGGQVTWQANAQTRPENQGTQRDHADGGVTQVDGRQGHKQRADFLQIVLRDVGHLQTEEVFDLHGTNGDTNP